MLEQGPSMPLLRQPSSAGTGAILDGGRWKQGTEQGEVLAGRVPCSGGWSLEAAVRSHLTPHP